MIGRNSIKFDWKYSNNIGQWNILLLIIKGIHLPFF